MPVVATPITVLPLDSVKMDERKRPATDDLGSTPPLKRQAVSVNGSASHADTDLPWNEDIDVSRETIQPQDYESHPFQSSLSIRHIADMIQPLIEIPKRCHPSTNARIQKGEERPRATIGLSQQTR